MTSSSLQPSAAPTAAKGRSTSGKPAKRELNPLVHGSSHAYVMRQPRGVALTLRGEQLLPYARRVTSLLDEAAVALREKPLDGPVRIGIPDEYRGEAAKAFIMRAKASLSASPSRNRRSTMRETT